MSNVILAKQSMANRIATMVIVGRRSATIRILILLKESRFISIKIKESA